MFPDDAQVMGGLFGFLSNRRKEEEEERAKEAEDDSDEEEEESPGRCADREGTREDGLIPETFAGYALCGPANSARRSHPFFICVHLWLLPAVAPPPRGREVMGPAAPEDRCRPSARAPRTSGRRARSSGPKAGPGTRGSRTAR